MALILEVVAADGRRTWHRLDALPLTVGRALTNDLILDDPYVDARHARIAPDEAGALRVEDLGSVNGLVADGARQPGALPVRAGVELRIGRTTLRFRDPDEPVAPALVDAPDAARRTPVAAASAAPVAPTRWIGTRGGQLATFLGTLALIALQAWLGSTARAGASTALTATFGAAFLMVLWAGAWAIVSRIALHRSNFAGHLTVLSGVVVVALGLAELQEWVTFVFPDSAVLAVLSLGTMLGVLLALVVGHLALASSMSRQRRWRTGLAVTGVALALGGLAALVRDDEFSDVPKFPSRLEPLAPRWLPTATVDDFGGALRDVRKDVDELAAGQASRAPR